MRVHQSSAIRIRLLSAAVALAAIVCVMLLSSAPAYAATGHIAGRVTDASSHAGLPGINVAVKQLFNSSWSQPLSVPTVLTDATGHYAISLPTSATPYRLEFYDPAQIHAGRSWQYARTVFHGSDITVSSVATLTRDATMPVGAAIQIRLVTEATGGPVTDGSIATNLQDLTENVGLGSYTNPQGYQQFRRLWTGPYALNGNSTTNWATPVWTDATGSNRLTIASAPSTLTVTVRLRHLPGAFTDVVRVWGNDRYDSSVQCAVERSKTTGGWSVTDLVIANGEDGALVDALSASGLAGAYDAPLVLTRSAALPPHVLSMIQQLPLGVHVHIVGGPAVVSANVVSQIAGALTAETIERIYGQDKYGTAAAVAKAMAAHLGPLPGTALIANGENPGSYYDSLALSPVSYARHFPILLVRAGSVPASTTAALAAIGTPTRYIAGGTSVVSTAVATALSVPPTNRLWGLTKIETARAVADKALAAGWLGSAQFGVATTLPDALSGAPVLGHFSGPLLLSDPSASQVPTATRTFVSAHSAALARGWVFGGTAVFKDSARLQMQDTLNF